MATQQSGKTGVKSDSQKQDNTRHGSDPAPETNQVPGAHGWKETTTTPADSQDLLHDVPAGKSKRSSGNA
ncbi:MAG TPA: hypothetical protein VKK31_29685 [Thermoanaerobaculia bacterium]|nr:hypothetical protein [Thermoanaerobaculia bacterium]